MFTAGKELMLKKSKLAQEVQFCAGWARIFEGYVPLRPCNSEKGYLACLLACLLERLHLTKQKRAYN
jgi:hypothetical protein